MVTTTVERLSPTRVKLNITVTPEELKPSITHAYQHIAESVNIPGFRKGKVPPPIIDQRVGRGEVISHAVNEGLDKFYRDAAREENLKPLGRPSADMQLSMTSAPNPAVRAWMAPGQGVFPLSDSVPASAVTTRGICG